MSESTTKDMFLYIGTYDDENVANEDLELVKALHKEGWVGTYDIGVVAKDGEGKLSVKRHTDSTGKGARRGLAVGAVLGVIFPPSILASGVVGAGVGSIVGKSFNEVSKDDLKELGSLLDDNQSALVVIGESRVEEMITKEIKNAIKEYKKDFNADVDEYNKALDELVKEV